LNELNLFENKGQVWVSSRVLADNFEKRHTHVLRAIDDKLLSPKLGSVKWFIEQKYIDKSGKENREFLLNKKGFSLIAMGFTGEKALEFQMAYIQQFEDMESLIKERLSSEWLKTRKDGKMIRRETTDMIQKFIPYAIEQGSSNAERSYIHYSNLANKTVGIKPNSRDKATTLQLLQISMIEDMFTKTIQEQMKKNVFYRNIYKLCKSKANQFAELTYLSQNEEGEENER
jgi:Rha family phage regulatory protein